MRSDRHRLIWVLAVILAGVGCTEEIPIEPVTSSADDWTPTYNIRGYGYQRVAIEIEGPPRKELVPNIARYVFSIRRETDTVDIPIDTFAYVYPSYMEVAGIYSRVHWTDPRVPTNTSFLTKLSVEYRNGVVRSTSGNSLPADPARGTILRRFDISSVTAGTQWWLGNKMTLWGSRPLFSSRGRLYVIDTVSGNPQYLGDLVIPGSEPNGSYLHSLGIDGDTLIAGASNVGSPGMRLVKVNLNTMVADSSLSISWGATEYCGSAAIYGGKIFLLLLLNDGRLQIKSYDSRTGLPLQAYPPSVAWQTFLYGLSYDGTDLRIALAADPFGPKPWFNPIYRLDPNSMAVTQVDRNPIWNFSDFVARISTSWLIDESGRRSIVEVRLEGV